MCSQINESILKYSGNLSFNDIEILLDTFKENIQKFNIDLVVRKRLFSILVESLENSYRHHTKPAPDNKHPLVELDVKLVNNFFIVEIGNYINNNNISEIAKRIDHINTLDTIGINRLYRASISNARISEKGGAGLGLIEIARNSRQKIKYKFVNENTDCPFFYLTIFLSKFANNNNKYNEPTNYKGNISNTAG